MTDSNIRELERRFRASGSVEDEAAWLRARVQAGELEQSKLELAALLGGAAGLTAEDHRLAQIDMIWEAWEAGLSSAPPEVIARSFVALGRFFMRSLDEAHADTRQLQRDFHSLEAAIVQQSTTPRLRILFHGGETLFALAGNLYVAAHISFSHDQGSDSVHYFGGEDRVQRALDQASRHESGAALLDCVRSELSPWLLGYRDPVRERVEARDSDR